MKIVSINLGVSGSTGKIINGISDKLKGKNNDFLIIAPWSRESSHNMNVYCIGNKLFRRINAYFGILTGLDGCFSVFSTLKALNRIKSFNPDVIHMHNLHNNYINLPMLFSYIKKYNIRVIWTLHDCWAFTGHCPHFIYEKCEKWQNGCYNCPRYKEYPKSFFDNSKFMWKLKKKWFSDVKDMLIVTPSQWLKNLVSVSFLNQYPVAVINNGIDLSVFKYTPSNFRNKHNLINKKIVLGVSFSWSDKKGLDVFIKLSNLLPVFYQIVLVGTNDTVDKKLPSNIITIHKTNDQNELAELYSVADVFVNPTKEDTYPTVNMEAIACGTPVVTFNTGGCSEIVDDSCGIVVKCNDIDSLAQSIIKVAENKSKYKKNIKEIVHRFDRNIRFEEYIKLYAE